MGEESRLERPRQPCGQLDMPGKDNYPSPLVSWSVGLIANQISNSRLSPSRISFFLTVCIGPAKNRYLDYWR